MALPPSLRGKGKGKRRSTPMVYLITLHCNLKEDGQETIVVDIGNGTRLPTDYTDWLRPLSYRLSSLRKKSCRVIGVSHTIVHGEVGPSPDWVVPWYFFSNRVDATTIVLCIAHMQ
jgi:hypothetical protein